MESIVNYNIHISNSIEQLSKYFAKLLVEKINNSKDHFDIALSGGSTPKYIFEYLAAHYQNTIQWSKVNFYWGDERCVPPSDPENNYKMAYDSLLSKLQIPSSNTFRIKGENIHLQWINNNDLHIDYNQSQKVFHSSKEFNGVRIDF